MPAASALATVKEKPIASLEQYPTELSNAQTEVLVQRNMQF